MRVYNRYDESFKADALSGTMQNPAKFRRGVGKLCIVSERYNAISREHPPVGALARGPIREIRRAES